MTPSHSARQHLDALTGLRFVAAFSIFLHHYFGRFNTRSIFHDFMLESGVAFFFVLSGFILVYIYARERNVLHLAGYLRRRFFRIYPLYAVTMLLVFVTRPNAIPDWPEGIIEIILVATMTQSWTGIWELATLFNGPAWSISTEFGFYLLFPILLRFYGSLGWVVLGLFIAKPVIQIVTLGTPLEAWAYSAHLAHPLFRLDQFALGMWVGQIFLKHRSTRAHTLNRRTRDIRATLVETATVILAVAFAFIPLSRPFPRRWERRGRVFRSSCFTAMSAQSLSRS